MDITYEKCGDYLIPNLIPDPEPERELRKFGLMRKSYLENHRRGIYSGLLLSGELKKHLLMIQAQAETRFDLLVEQMAEREGVTEQLKAQEQMLWVRKIQTLKKSKLSHRYADKYGIVRKESLDFFLFTLQSFMIKLEVNKYEFIRIKQYV